MCICGRVRGGFTYAAGRVSMEMISYHVGRKYAQENGAFWYIHLHNFEISDVHSCSISDVKKQEFEIRKYYILTRAISDQQRSEQARQHNTGHTKDRRNRRKPSVTR